MRDFQITRHILGIYAHITKTNITSCPPISKLQQYLFRGVSWMSCSFNCLYHQGAVSGSHFHHLADGWFCWSFLTWTCHPIVIKMDQSNCSIQLDVSCPQWRIPAKTFRHWGLAVNSFRSRCSENSVVVTPVATSSWRLTRFASLWVSQLAAITTVTGLLENQLGDDASNVGLAKRKENSNNSPSWSKVLPILIIRTTKYSWILVRSHTHSLCP